MYIRDTIRAACMHLKLWSPVAEELLMLTWAHESEGGKHRKQVGGGPALGVFQMESVTFDDIRENYLRFRYDLRVLVEQLGNIHNPHALVNNDNLAAGMARIQYYRARKKLPASTDPQLLAEYWCHHYHSVGHRDPQKIADAIADYEKYVKGVSV